MISRKEHWQNIYSEKSASDVSWYQAQPQLSLDLIRASGVGADKAIIDVGGGASVLVDRLHSCGYSKLSVLDISGNALACARNRLGAAAENIEWIQADITEFQPPHQYALWHDRAVFHFLTDKSDREKYVDVLERALLPDGHLIIAAFAIGGPVKCSGLDIVQYDAPRMSAELGDGFSLVEEQSEVHVTPAEKEQQFNYFYFTRSR